MKHQLKSKKKQSDLEHLSIVIISHNRLEELQTNLPKLLDLAKATHCEICIQDNGSTDGSRQFIEACLKGTPHQYSFGQTNLGVAAGRNAARRLATRAFILNIDDDSWIGQRDIICLLKHLQQNPECGACSPRVVQAKTHDIQNDHGTDIVSTLNYHGACHMLRRSTLVDVGPIDPECDFGGEEFDFCVRAWDKGWTIDYVPSSTAYHNNILREGPEGKWRLKRRVYNNCRLHWKYFPLPYCFIFSTRYTVTRILTTYSAHGLKFAFNLALTAIGACAVGRKKRYRLSPETLRRFKNPRATPDFGNEQLVLKLRRKLSGMRQGAQADK